VKPTLGAWWIAYVASYFVTFLSLSEAEPSLPIGLASAAALGVAAIALGELILAISRAQQKRIDRAAMRQADVAPPRLAKRRL
jgi:hypothetical protein